MYPSIPHGIEGHISHKIWAVQQTGDGVLMHTITPDHLTFVPKYPEELPGPSNLSFSNFI